MFRDYAILVGVVALLVVWRLRSPLGGALHILVALAAAAKDFAGYWSLDPRSDISDLGEATLFIQILGLAIYRAVDLSKRPAPARSAPPAFRIAASLAVGGTYLAAVETAREANPNAALVAVTGPFVPAPGTLRVRGAEIQSASVRLLPDGRTQVALRAVAARDAPWPPRLAVSAGGRPFVTAVRSLVRAGPPLYGDPPDGRTEGDPFPETTSFWTAPGWSFHPAPALPPPGALYREDRYKGGAWTGSSFVDPRSPTR